MTHRQTVLFGATRDLITGRQRGFPAPPLPDLAAVLDNALDDHAARHGWARGLIDTTRHSIHILLALQDTPGAAITFTDATLISQLPSRSIQPVVEVLAATGMFHDDRDAPLESWFATQTTGVSEPMLDEVRHWFRALRDGSTTTPRSRPRTLMTIRKYVAGIAPALHAWTGSGHASLREITPHDILNVLPPNDIHRRQSMITGLRSLFRFLKGRRVVFLNPTTRLSAGPVVRNQPLPLDLAIVRDAINSRDPARSALAALLAFHAPRMQHLQALRLTDLRDGRLLLPDRSIPLATPVRDKLRDWLDHRAQRWPNTINPYLFINQYTAVRTRPVSKVWITATLGIPGKNLRNDRIVDEAIASEGDIRRLCDLFGIDVATALHYAHTTQRPPPHGHLDAGSLN